MANQIKRRAKPRARCVNGKWIIEGQNLTASGPTVPVALHNYGRILALLEDVGARNCDGSRCRGF